MFIWLSYNQSIKFKGECHMNTKYNDVTMHDLRKNFFQAVSDNNYSMSYQYFFELRFKSLEAFMKEHGIERYTPDVGHSFIEAFTLAHTLSHSTELALKSFVFKLNDIYHGVGFSARHNNTLQPFPIGFQDLLDDYAAYCLENGNKLSTISYKILHCTAFCRYLNSINCYSIDQMNESMIIQFCLANANNNKWRCIRWFLLFLHENGKCQDYSYLVPKEIKKEPFPSIYSEKEISKMDAAVDTSTATGKRDICILLLESRLAMRSGDIVNLTFENVNFEDDRVTFYQEKTGKPVDLPLLPEVKKSLQEYIDTARPESDDEHIFLRVYAPFSSLTTASLRNISKKYLQKAKIEPAGRRFGPHSRRASAATSMINSGISYDAVKKILGHTDPNAIRHYAALDKTHLRCCALQAPSPTGILKELLEGRRSL